MMRFSIGRLSPDEMRWRRIASTLARLTICIVTVVAVTTALYAVPIRDRASIASLILLFVMLIFSAVLGFRYALFVSLLAALAFSWLLPPVGVFWLDDPRDVVTMVSFLVIGIVASHLSDRVRKQALNAKQREQALRRNEAYLAEGQRLTHAGSWAWNPVTGEVHYWSEGMFRIFGLDPQKGIPGRAAFWQTCVYPEDRERVYAQIQKAVGEKRDYFIEHRTVLPDGSVRYHEALGHPVLNSAGEVVEYIGTAVDVTERTRAERDLRETETRFRTYVDHATDAFFVHVRGEQARIVDVNRQACESLGYTREELIGMSPRDFDHGMDEGGLQRLITRVDAGEAVTFESSHQRKDGAVFPVEVRLRPFCYEGRRLVLSLARDITVRKRAEAEARDSERRFRELHAELAHASRLATMGQLTASIAHEVKQPVGATLTNAQAALRFLDRKPVDLGEIRQTFDDIIKDSIRASDIFDRIRDLGKKAPPRRDRFEINTAIREVIELTHGEAVKNGVSVATQLAGSLPLIEGDRVQIQQVILNLIINGIQAMGGVAVDSRELRISSEHTEPEGVRVAVRDSGPGLNPDCVERVFEPFYTTKSEGMGMGLSICRSIIEAHGGQLVASANVPNGAVFQFTVPVRLA
jgi:PAS domain S-box-containing protein